MSYPMSGTSADAMNDYWAKRIAEEQAKQAEANKDAVAAAAETVKKVETAKAEDGTTDWTVENNLAINKRLDKESIKKLQTYLKVEADGDFGRNSKKALQTLLGVKADGIIGPASVKALQTKLLNEGLYTDAIDGKFGNNTAVALKAFIDKNA